MATDGQTESKKKNKTIMGVERHNSERRIYPKNIND